MSLEGRVLAGLIALIRKGAAKVAAQRHVDWPVVAATLFVLLAIANKYILDGNLSIFLLAEIPQSGRNYSFGYLFISKLKLPACYNLADWVKDTDLQYYF